MPCAVPRLAVLCVALMQTACLAPALIAGAGAAAGGGAALGGVAAASGSVAAVTGTAAAATTGGVVAGTAATVAATTATVAGAGVAVGTVGAGVTGTAGALAGGGALTEVAVLGGSVQAAAVTTTGLVNTQVIAELQASLPASGTGVSAALAPALGVQITAQTVFVPDEILVTNLSRRGLDAARALGLGVSAAGTLNNLALTVVRLQVPARIALDQALFALQKADPEGRFEKNPVYRLAGETSACEGLRCYAQQLVRWPQRCNMPVRLGMLDGAVDAAHPALAGGRVETRRFAPGAPGKAEREHGTAVAALLAGGAGTAFPGLLPNSQLFAADVFSLDASGAPYTDAARLAAGLDWLAVHQPSVINISLAGPDSGLLHSAVRRLVQSGTGVVAAVGNLGPTAPPQYPAAYPEVVGVTAVDRQMQVYPRANRGGYVAIAAPGVGIWTAGEDLGRFRDGTSFAAPFVTAAYSVVSARQPDLAPLGVAAQLRQGARPLGDSKTVTIYGAGLLQAPSCR